MRLCKKLKKFTAKTENVVGKYDIATPEETIDEIISKNKSITRFGDGEIDFIYGKGMNYQKFDEKLACRLKEVLNSDYDDLLVGMPNAINTEYFEEYTGVAIEFWPRWVHENMFRIIKLLDRKRKYYSTQITRFYLDYKDKSNKAEYVKKIKKIWDKKDIVIIEGDKSRLGVGNDLFDNMNSIERIICPSENAFDRYKQIVSEASKVDKNKLILLALGPTATVLAYDLFKIGYRVIDIGHIDIEYEWFLRKATEKVRIETKYVTEVKNGRTNIAEINDEKYMSEVIAKIL